MTGAVQRVRDLFPELADANLTEHLVNGQSLDRDAANWRRFSCLAWDIELKGRGLDVDDDAFSESWLVCDVVEAQYLGADVLYFDRVTNRGEVVPITEVDLLDENANRVAAAFADWEAMYGQTTDEEDANLLERFGQLALMTLERYAAVRSRLASRPLTSAWGLVGLLHDEAFAFLKPLCASVANKIGDEVEADVPWTS